MGNRLVIHYTVKDLELALYWHWGVDRYFEILSSVSKVAKDLTTKEEICYALCNEFEGMGLGFFEGDDEAEKVMKYAKDNNIPMTVSRSFGIILTTKESIDEALLWADDLVGTDSLRFSLEDIMWGMGIKTDDELFYETITEENYDKVKELYNRLNNETDRENGEC